MEPSQDLDAALVEELELVGFDLSPESAQPGDTLGLNIYWQTLSAPTEDYVLLLRLYDQEGHPAGRGMDGPEVVGWATPVGSAVVGQAHLPAGPYYPTSLWREGEVVAGRYDYRVPIDAAAGAAELRASLLLCQDGLKTGSWRPPECQSFAGESVVAFQSPADGETEALVCRGSEVGSQVLISPIEVEATERVFSPPEVQHRAKAGNLDGKVTLYGYDLSAQILRPGDTLHLTLYWQGLGTMEDVFDRVVR